MLTFVVSSKDTRKRVGIVNRAIWQKLNRFPKKNFDNHSKPEAALREKGSAYTENSALLVVAYTPCILDILIDLYEKHHFIGSVLSSSIYISLYRSHKNDPAMRIDIVTP